jgi:signal transduction histidine kinase/DNA-binding response OmpR family regulator
MYPPFRYILFLVLLQLTHLVVAQNYTLSYRVLDNEEGLLGSRVTSFHEDKYGFIWLSTQRGIARYDGHQFQWFTEINSKLRGLPEGTAKPFVEDDKGNIWISSVDKMDVINRQTLEILPFENYIKEELPFENAGVLFQKAKGDYIIFKAETSNNWYVYHSSTGLKELTFIPKNALRAIVQGDKIWIQYRDNPKIEAYHYLTGKKLIETTFIKNQEPKRIKNYNLNRDLFWLPTSNSLELFEITKAGIKTIFKIEQEQSLRSGHVFVTYLPNRKLFVTNFGANKNGLSVIDTENQRLIPIENSKDKVVTDARIGWGTQKDIIWARSNRSMVLLNIKETYFNQYLPESGNNRGLRVFDNHLYVGNRKVPLDNPDEVQTIDKNIGNIVGIEQDIKDEFWVGTFNEVLQLDLKDNTVKQKLSSKYYPIFWTLTRSQEGQWWVGNLRGRSLLISNYPTNDSILLFQQYNEFQELENKRVNHLMEDGEHIWACSPVGLFLIHKQKGVIQKYNAEVARSFQIPTNNVHFLYKDATDTYWLATSSEGLIRFKVNSNFEIIDLKRYAVEDGLSSNVLYAIIEDDKERLWISTLNGISCLDKKTDAIQAFFKEDGIRELEFNRTSYTKAPDGRIFFGSIAGVTGFYPDEVIKANAYNIPIYITQFLSYKKKGNQEIDQTLDVQQNQKIVIQPSERFFRLDVAMLDIFHSNQLNYSYQIEGLFDDFKTIESNTIEIGGLPYGRYTLRVRGQGADKRFSSQELEIPLIVVRPFYLRWWFIALALVMIGISIFQIYQWRIRQLEERKRELELLVQERTSQIRKDKTVIEEQAMQLKELDELKSKFFANISHELRTPLTLLLAPMESILKSKELSNKNFTYLQMMRQNGNKLLKRINELLDLSRLDANRLEVNEQPTFLYPFFKTILSTFESAANLKDIQLLFEYDLDDNLQVKLDDDKVEKIITNYLGNALKFTPKKGEIKLKVTKANHQLLISVSDTGIGILKKDLVKIFDRFYQSSSEKQKQGTGIGLSLCRELAKVLNGKVWATSEIGKGSIFYLELPIVETFATKEETPIEETITPVPVVEVPQNSITRHFRPNILIVEDNPDLRQFLVMILQEDYNVVAVENGKEAFERLTADGLRLTEETTPTHDRQPSAVNRQPSLIISDIMMPIMDGIELLTKVKADKNLQHIPMIMLTARQSVEVKIEALRIGVDDYLTKPFREEELKARVANLIKNSQNRGFYKNEILPLNQAITAISVADLNWLKELEGILKENISKPNFKMTEAANQMAISPRRMQQKIKEITGLTTKQYQRSIRLHQARTLFKSGKVQTVSEVMYQVGFENHSYFSKIYIQEFGITPSQELK